jgi:predicted RNase H-like nuclease (RuvC/YqgF family)
MGLTNLRHSPWRLVAIALLPLWLVACAGQPYQSGSYNNAPLSPSERQLREQTSVFGNSYVQSCVATGAGLALLTYVLSGENRGRRSAMAFAAGCGIGMGVNSYVQQRRGQYRNNEQRMNAYIADLRKSNRHLQQLLATSARVREQDRQRIAEIDRAYFDRSISGAEAERRMDRVRSNRDHLRETLDALLEKQADWERISRIERNSGVNTRRLDEEIARLRQQVASLETELDLMDQEISATPVPA